MDQITSQAIDVFRARTDSAVGLGLATRLGDLEIESLDLAVIILDIEDAFGIDFPYDPDEEADAFETVGAVVERVRSLLATKLSRPLSPIAALARPKSLWVTMGSRA